LAEAAMRPGGLAMAHGWRDAVRSHWNQRCTRSPPYPCGNATV
jgi:hypothetical protein